jgi:hypothetical protein
MGPYRPKERRLFNAVGIRIWFHGVVKNNVIYANQLQGILASGGVPGAQIRSNTIYQPLGDAVRVQDNTGGLDVRNNILWAQTGYALYVDPSSQVGFKRL